LIEEILVDTDREIGEISIVIHWKGGVHTEVRVRRRRHGQNRHHTTADVVDAVRVLSQILSDKQTAGYLNRNNLRTGRGNRWTQERVNSLRKWRKIPCYSPERQQTEGWMNLTKAAAYVDVNPKVLRRAVEQGKVEASHPLPDGPWVFNREYLDQPATRETLGRLRLRQRHPGGQPPGELSLFKSTKSCDDAL
jgi:hypothetical protein